MSIRLVILFRGGGSLTTFPMEEKNSTILIENLYSCMQKDHDGVILDISDGDGKILMAFKKEEVIGFYRTTEMSPTEEYQKRATEVLEDIHKDISRGDEWKSE